MHNMTRVIEAFVLAVLLASPAMAEDPASSHMTNNIEEAYAILKNIIGDQYGRGRSQLDIDGDDDSNQPYALTTCASSDSVYVTEGALRQTLIAIAFDTLVAEQLLSQANYPNELWVSEIQNFERESLEQVKQGARITDQGFTLESTSVEINNNIQSSGLALNTTMASAECGGGPATYLIRIQPPTARALLIPKAMYNYCQEIGIDPADLGACDFWHSPIEDQQSVALGGIYKLRFMFNDSGALTSIDEFDFDRYFDGDTVVLNVR